MTSTFEPAESYSYSYATAIKDIVESSTGRDAFTLDELPDDLPYEYVEVHLARRYTESPARGGGMRDDVGWRLSLRVVSKDIENARLMEDRIHRRFRFPVLLGGVPTLVRFESGGGDFDRDDERYFHALTDFVFVR